MLLVARTYAKLTNPDIINPMSGMLVNKLAVITGAGRGIGQATAFLFSKEGAKLVLSDLDKEPLDETVSKINSSGGKALGIVGNVTKKEDCDKIMETAASKWGDGSIDVLCNIAGTTRDKVIHKMSLDDWNFILNVNLTGTFLCIQAAEPYMREVAKKEQEKGNAESRKIINVSSTSADGNVGQANYAASKAGIEGLTKTVAKEWARFNITCNAVAPGYIDTRLTQVRKEGESFGLPVEQRQIIEMLHKQTGLAREMGKSEDIANAILFFASDHASFVTGQVLTVAGGMIGSI